MAYNSLPPIPLPPPKPQAGPRSDIPARRASLHSSARKKRHRIAYYPLKYFPQETLTIHEEFLRYYNILYRLATERKKNNIPFGMFELNGWLGLVFRYSCGDFTIRPRRLALIQSHLPTGRKSHTLSMVDGL